MRSIILIALAALAALTLSQKLPNIDYLSFGYNIYRGNPHSTKEGGDPGFVVQRVFDLTYDEHRRTQDGRYEVPDRTDVGHGESCELSFGSTGISGSSSYMHSLEEEVSVSIDIFGAKFKASNDYKRVEEQTHSYSNLFTFAKAVCEVYTARINLPLAPKLSANFVEAANELPEELDMDAYMDFIDNFGTHAVMQIRMGARFGCQSLLSEEAWSSLESMGVRVETAASYSGYGVTGAVDTRTEEQKRMARAFDEKKSETKLSVIGSRPVKGGDWKAWMEEVYQDPMPLHYTLVSMSDIFHPQYFREVKITKDLAKLRKNMEEALRQYCQRLRDNKEILDCSAPPPDPPLPKHAVSCRFCAKECGTNFPLDNGAIAVDTNWEHWAFDYGQNCMGGYGRYDIKNGGVRLCCEREDDRHEGACRICTSCGGDYPERAGAEQVDQSRWEGFTLAYDDECRGDMRNRPHPEGGFPLCCKKDAVCSFCSSCGGKWGEEVGVIGADVNWPDFFQGRGRACEGPVTRTDVSRGLKLCCKNRGQIYYDRYHL